jgi:cytochrome c oxidase assembly protein subunit 15
MVMTAISIDRSRPRSAPADRAVALWLFGCCAMIFAMVVIGGVTRLTESGLSITRWQPISGILPPLDEADWRALYALWRDTPQGRAMPGLTLAEFERIFWWEWAHRLWGRLIGLAFALPLVWFWATGRLTRALRWPLLGLFGLGALQGAVGWWMVASGLRDQPWVSPYRLTVHLSLALVIYACALWLALGLAAVARAGAVGWRHARANLVLVALTIVAGGFVAGTDAGLIHNEFPTMGGGLLPPDYRNPALGWLANAFENQAAVQFHHRLLAILTTASVLAWTWRARSRPLAATLAVAVLAQAGLGVATLLAGVPIMLAALHQAGAVLLLTAALLAVWATPPARA